MEWFTGLALLPALVCGVMMGGMALGAILGLRRTRGDTGTPPSPSTERTSEELPEGAAR
jgi:hypothetical protein